MKTFTNISLLPYNTFKIDVKAKQMIVIEKEEDITQLKLKEDEYWVLGGGSNILFTQDVDKVILKNELKGKVIVKETEDDVYIKIGSGENWHQIVMWAVNNNWNGIENLALIPGTMGAAPIQNIGAYGVEIKDVLHTVKFYRIDTQQMEELQNFECQFAYRDSIFKKSLKNKVFITEVVLKLKKKNHIYRTDYGNLQEEIARLQQNLSPKVIAEAVIKIRQSKLPDPDEIGNAGSFFKNPEVSLNTYLLLKERFPNIVAFKQADGRYKLAAGWLIENCGLKGYEHRGAAVHTRQALVIINKQNAKGKDIWDLAQIVMEKVYETYGIQLEPEVNII